MKFYFDIEDYDFNEFYNSKDFRDAVVAEAARSVCDSAFDNFGVVIEAVNDEVKKIVESREEEIVQKIIDLVAEKVARKRAIAAITPKASELAAADKANEEYFATMIDKAIARRFK